MTKLDRLIAELFPDGVEYKPLGEIAQICDGVHQTPKYTDSGVPFVSVENIYDLKSTKKFISFNDFEKYKVKPQNEDLFMTRIGRIGLVNIVDNDDPLAYYVTLTLIRPLKISARFLMHYIRCKFFQNDMNRRSLLNAVPPKINLGEIGKIIVPVPPLPIQQEIARILDKFTTLEAELEARKKQYEYYCEHLINNPNFSSVKLSSIADIYLGLTYTPNYVANGVRFISAQNTSKDYLDLSTTKYISEDEYKQSTSNAKPKRGDILFTRVGSNLGHPVIIDTDEELCIFVSLGFLRIKDNDVLNTYIKHWMNTDLFWSQVRKNVHGAAKVNLNTGWLKNFDVSIPTLHEQKRIVELLNNFEKITNDISVGLPAEIATRRKQYEYYRDKLLTFKEKIS